MNIVCRTFHICLIDSNLLLQCSSYAMLNFDLELNVILRGFKKNVDREKLGNAVRY